MAAKLRKWFRHETAMRLWGRLSARLVTQAPFLHRAASVIHSRGDSPELGLIHWPACLVADAASRLAHLGATLPNTRVCAREAPSNGTLLLLGAHSGYGLGLEHSRVSVLRWPCKGTLRCAGAGAGATGAEPPCAGQRSDAAPVRLELVSMKLANAESRVFQAGVVHGFSPA